jgi:hypothetical protein
LWRKGSRKWSRWRRATRQRALIPSFFPVNVLVNLIAVNQMDPYDSDSSDGGSEFPSQSTIPEPPPFNDPNYETYKHGQQFLIIDHTANQRNCSEISKIWQHGGERRRVDDGTMDRYWRCGHCNNKRILKCPETGRGATFNSRAEICTLRSQTYSFSTTPHFWLYCTTNAHKQPTSSSRFYGRRTTS